MRSKSFRNSGKFSGEAARFLALFVPVFFIPYSLTFFADFSSLNEAVAGAEVGVLRYFGFNALNYGSLILFNGEAFRIVVECTGFVMALLFLSLVFATEIPRKKALLAIALGVPFLLLFNLLRLALTMTAGPLLGSVEALHTAFWFLDGGIVLLAWFAAFKYDLQCDRIK